MALSQQRRDLARSLWAALLAFGLVWALELSGWLSAGNDTLFSLYYRLTPSRQSAHRVLVLSSDQQKNQKAQTLWNEETLTAALLSLMKGQPSVVALVDPEQSFGLSSAQVSKILSHPAWQQRVFAARSGTSTFAGAKGVTHVASTPNDAGWVRKNIVEVVSKRIAQSRVATGALPVNYLAERDALPKIPFSTLLSSQAQTGSFEGNIVIIGKTQIPEVHPINTPIGPMSPLEVHAHAISGLVDGVVWDEPSPLVRHGFLLLLLGAWCLRLRSVHRPGRVRVTLACCAALVGLDWTLFYRGLVLWGPSQAICGLWIAQFLIVRDSLANITDKVGYLQTRLAEMLPSAIAVRENKSESLVDDAFWQDLVDFGRAYVKFDFEGMLAELPEKEWHIQLRASTGASIQAVAEKRRDIRRAPFRAPFLTQKSGWARNFLEDKSYSKSLVVPMHHESKLYGYWLLHMRESQEIDTDFMRTCEGIGRQMAAVIAEKRGHQALGAQELLDRAELAMQEVQRDVSRLEDERRWAIELVEQNSDAMMMASLWGPIEMMNQAMRQRMELLFPNGIPDEDLRAVIAKLCAASSEQVQTLMRSAVVDAQCVAIPRAPDEEETFVQGDFAYSLRTIEVGRRDDEVMSQVPDMKRVRFLLTAKNRYDVPQVIKQACVLAPPPLQTPAKPSAELLADEPKTQLYQPVATPKAEPVQEAPAPETSPPETSPPETSPPETSPELIAANQAPEEPHAPAPEPLIYFEDGWEDWTPRTRLDRNQDLSVPADPLAKEI